ncbi:MAG: ferrous iron transport protein A [bacterium]|jgi:ferrous iron transport protein A
MSEPRKLSLARPGDQGVIVQVGDPGLNDDHALELERRLLELGFVEGARVELLHEGLFGRDPIAMKVDDMRVALRRHEAASLTVRFEPDRVD